MSSLLTRDTKISRPSSTLTARVVFAKLYDRKTLITAADLLKDIDGTMLAYRQRQISSLEENEERLRESRLML
jgi:hypothetical protein